MNIFDDIDEEMPDIVIKKSKVMAKSVYENLSPGDEIRYSVSLKHFVVGNSTKDTVFIGWFLGYNRITKLVYVLYKGFLSKEMIYIPATIKNNYVNSYIIKTFDLYKSTIKAKMPRIKKLKRINLRMMTKELSLILYNNFNNFIQTYSDNFGDDNSKVLKAAIVTTPFYILDNNYLKLYHFSSNEMTIPDIESEGNFLAYFCFNTSI